MWNEEDEEMFRLLAEEAGGPNLTLGDLLGALDSMTEKGVLYKDGDQYGLNPYRPGTSQRLTPVERVVLATFIKGIALIESFAVTGCHCPKCTAKRSVN